MTARQAAASRLTGFQQQLQRKANTAYDDTVYVPGVKPTTAEITANPELAAQQRVIFQGNPKATKWDADNNERRVDFYNNLQKTPTITETLKDARSTQAQANLDAAFSSKKATDLQPAVDAVTNILNTPRNIENTTLQGYVQPLLKRMYNVDGTLKSDPEQIYGLREDIARMMSKPSQAADSNLSHITGELGDIKSVLDGVIESGAPGYKKYLSDFAAASRPIDEQEMLQDLAPTVINKTTGNLTLQGISSALNSIVGQMGRPGLNPAKSISDETMEALFDLRQDLLRQGNRELGKAAGSPTQHNLSVAADIATAGAHTMAHAAAHAVAGPGGNMLLGKVLDDAASKAGSRRRAALENLIFNPPNN